MIYISEVSRRGSAHPDWNEDNFYYKYYDNIIIGGVFDGCSSGKDSYFASKLFANIFRKTLFDINQENIKIENFHTVVYDFFKNLHKAIKALGLNPEEILSTAVLFVYELNSFNLLVKYFGDGVAYSNNEKFEFCNNDEENKPDYIGYSLDKILKVSDFNNYWDQKTSFISNTKDFSISTDGIFSFRKVNEFEPAISVENYLIKDKFLYKNPSSLKRKLNIIRNKGYEHYDDVTIVRVVVE